MIVVGWILTGMLVVRFIVVTINFFSQLHLPGVKKNGSELLLSVLIPARNEADKLPQLIGDLQLSDYSNMEILVCDDQSTDGTPELLEQYQKEFPHLRSFRNETLPEGWKGKNHACHQLALQARGDYLLFLDADVRIGRDFISRALSYIRTKKWNLLSMFPQQILASVGEWKTVPIMNWILLSFLPLPLVRLKWFSSLSAANGQMMLFEGSAYRKNCWHEKMKNETVEDISIARAMKKRKEPIGVLLGKNDISCRMYSGYEEAITGFSRNVHQYFGGSRAWMIFYNILVWFRIPLLCLFLSPVYGLGAIVTLFVMKMMVSKMSGQDLRKNIRFHLNHLLSFTLISLRNIENYRKGKVEWKGRQYAS
ncbi:MAG TPA: glycosyltransferase family 2 protein [Prolixibacteraceae bacterium]|nr:glycosyltransferase family 2 protein [Prolixibacteraceae bacterium]